MSSQSNHTGSSFRLFVLFLIVIFISINVVGCDTDNSETIQSTGADPQAFETALDLYTFTPKEKLTVSAYNDLLDRFASKVDQSIYPEDKAFRADLLRLDGAVDYKAILDRIEYAASIYSELATQSDMVVDPALVDQFLQANEAYAAGELEKATAAYLQILEADPSYLDARNNLGLCDLHLGNNISAIMHFQMVLTAAPNYLGAEQNLSVALERIGLTEQAYEHAQKVVVANDELPMAQYNLGWFQTQNKEFDAAAKSYSRAMKLREDYPKAQRASAINDLENGNKLSKSELATLTEEEQTAYTQKASTIVAPFSTPWWWWVGMIVALMTIFILIGVASNNSRDGTATWGVISLIAFIVAMIVIAIWFRSNIMVVYGLLALAGLNVLIMIPTSRYKSRYRYR